MSLQPLQLLQSWPHLFQWLDIIFLSLLLYTEMFLFSYFLLQNNCAHYLPTTTLLAITHPKVLTGQNRRGVTVGIPCELGVRYQVRHQVTLSVWPVALHLNPWAAVTVSIKCVWPCQPSPARKGASTTLLLGGTLAQATTVAPSFGNYNTCPDGKLHKVDTYCRKTVLLPSAPVLSLDFLPHHYHWLGDTGLEVLLILALGSL